MFPSLLPSLHCLHVGTGQHAEELLCPRIGKDLLRGAIHSDALVHEDDLVRMLCHHIEVVGDEDDGHVLLLPELGTDFVEKLQARPIYAGDGLVEEQKVGHGVEGEGEKHPLELATGERPQAPVDEVVSPDPSEITLDARAVFPAGGEPDRLFRKAG